MTDDPQDRAELLDEDKVDAVDDFSGDEYGDGLPEYPPDQPLGVDTVGVTPVEEDAGESFAERTWREEPDFGEAGGERTTDEPSFGQAVEPHAMGEDHEEQAVADYVGGEEDGPEAGAMHIEEEPG